MDHFLIELVGTPNKSKLGANAILPVSMTFASASANSENKPLYRYLNTDNKFTLPLPCMNVINRGQHVYNNVDFQEFMIAPHNSPSFSEAIRMGLETFHALKDILKSKNYFTGEGDEGGFAPNLKSNEEALDVILQAIKKAGYKPGTDISICLDPAVSELWQDGKYVLSKSTQQKYTSDQMIELWKSWVDEYPIILLEDGLRENDWEGWKNLTQELGNKIELVGDDLLCTNEKFPQKAIDLDACNSILIKLNQIGTVTEILTTMALSKANNYRRFMSHRSREAENTFIADLVVATAAGKIKTGSGCRGERIAKYNQLIRIEQELGDNASFAGIKVFKNQG